MFAQDDLNINYDHLTLESIYEQWESENQKREGIYVNFGAGLSVGGPINLEASDGTVLAKCSDAGISDLEKHYLCDSNVWNNSFPGSGSAGATAAIGLKKGVLRFELEASLRQTETSDSRPSYGELKDQEYSEANESIGDVEVTTQFFNAYWDVGELWKIRPFIGGGGGNVTLRYKYDAHSSEVLGAVRATPEDVIYQNSVWGSQVVAGINIPVLDKADFNLKGRYLLIPDVTNTGEWSDGTDYNQRLKGRGLFDVQAGFTLYFGGF